ncbi:MAG TPA: VWA domain-containing protein [Thermoanaerobaculia bacterium]
MKWAVPLVALTLIAADKPKPVVPSMGETIDITVVNVDLFVTDRKGNRIRGLTANDFEVFEDGVKQPVSNFAEYTGEARATLHHGSQDAQPQAAPAVAVPQQQGEPRTVVLFVEPVMLPDFRVEPLFASLKQLVRETIRPGDAMAIVTWSPMVGSVERQPFTDDIALLEAALDELAKDSVGARMDPYNEMRRRAIDLKEMEMAMASALAARGESAGLPPGQGMFDARGYAWIAMLEQRAKIRAINALMSGISGAPGKKAILLATRRLGEFAGAEFFYASGAQQVPLEARNELDMRRELESITATANANNITVYPLFIEGLTTHFPADASISPTDIMSTSPTGVIPAGFEHLVLSNETAALGMIAERTGGVMAWGNKNIQDLLSHVQDDFDAYYSLGYRTQTRREDRSRKIAIKPKNPEYLVRARRQFVEKSETTKMKERVIASLFRAGERPIFDITAELGELKKVKKNRWSVPLKISIPVESLTALPQADGTHAGAFSIFLVPGQILGDVGEVVQKTQPYTIKPDELEKAKTGYFTYEMDVMVDSATKKLAIGVYDDVSTDYGIVQLDVMR